MLLARLDSMNMSPSVTFRMFLQHNISHTAMREE